MSEDLPSIEEPTYWLHVPLQNREDHGLEVPRVGERILVLGRAAQLLQDIITFAPPGSASISSRHQWLLFDPLTEHEAVSVLNELRLRLPMLSLRHQTAFSIPKGELEKSPTEHQGKFSGSRPTLIPAEFQPQPYWARGFETTGWNGADMLGVALDGCPRVEDERIATAIDLAISAHFDALPRSVFLTHLTIVDSLAIRGDRPLNTREWLAKKMEESLQLNDQGLTTSLRDLKQEVSRFGRTRTRASSWQRDGGGNLEDKRTSTGGNKTV